MLRQPIYPDIDRNKYNNGNLHEYDPYMIINGINVIDEDWWRSLTAYNKAVIEEKLGGKYILSKISIPHEIQEKDNDDKFLSIVHQTYIDSFDYNLWYDPHSPYMPLNVSMIEVSPEIKPLFLKMQKMNIFIDSNDLQIFANNIDAIMKKGEKYFIRMSSTSGKNEKSIEPVSTVNEVMRRLSTIKLFSKKEYERIDKQSYLIILPWNDKIDPRYEFRIFVVNGKLTCASPQNWFECHQYSSDELEIFEEVLINMTFIDKFMYQTYVADIYIDIETKRAHLIELNPFGAHCGAGSSLFNWITDYDLLHGINNDQPVLRYLSVINY